MESLRVLWDNIKHNNIHIIGVPEREENEQEIEILFEEILAQNFLNMVKEKGTQVQDAQSPNQDEPKETHTMIVDT